MTNPLHNVSRSMSLQPEKLPIMFSVQGSTYQKAAFYIYKTSWGVVSWADESPVYGDVYTFPPRLNETVCSSRAIAGSGRFARAQNLACLQGSVAGRHSNDKVEQAASRLIHEMNSEQASEYSLKVSGKLIAMQLHLAGIRIGGPLETQLKQPKERIDENGCFESIGLRPFSATLLSGPNGRPAVLEKRVRFVQACQSAAQKSLAEQIRTFGPTSEMTSAEDLVHRAKLTLVAAPTDYLRERHELPVRICEAIDLIEYSSKRAFHNDAPPPSKTLVYREMIWNDPDFQEYCNSIRTWLVEFGNPIP